MNKLITLFFLAFVFTSLVFSQAPDRFDLHHRHQKKLQILEKARLIEYLNLNEKQAEIFFARKQAHEKKIIELRMAREQAISRIENYIAKDTIKNEKNILKASEEILEIEKQIFNERRSFIESLRDILNAEQIAKLLIFETQFRKELGEALRRKYERR